MSVTETIAADNLRIDEQIRVFEQLSDQLDDSGKQLLQRLDRLHGDALCAEMDRVLAIAGRLCMQFEAPDLFRRIFSLAMEGCRIAPGDEPRFLDQQRIV